MRGSWLFFEAKTGPLIEILGNTAVDVTGQHGGTTLKYRNVQRQLSISMLEDSTDSLSTHVLTSRHTDAAQRYGTSRTSTARQGESIKPRKSQLSDRF